VGGKSASLVVLFLFVQIEEFDFERVALMPILDRIDRLYKILRGGWLV